MGVTTVNMSVQSTPLGLSVAATDPAMVPLGAVVILVGPSTRPLVLVTTVIAATMALRVALIALRAPPRTALATLAPQVLEAACVVLVTGTLSALLPVPVEQLPLAATMASAPRLTVLAPATTTLPMDSGQEQAVRSAKPSTNLPAAPLHARLVPMVRCALVVPIASMDSATTVSQVQGIRAIFTAA